MKKQNTFGLFSSRRKPARLCGAFLLIMAFFLGGCSSPQGPYMSESDSVAWTFGPQGIVLNMKASEGLNQYRDRAHTLAMCVYQLSSSKSFDERAQTNEGVSTLVGCQRFDETVIHFEQIFVTPGENRSVVLDRREGTRAVGLAAGYYASNPGSCAKSTPIPVETTGVFSTRREAAKLVLDLLLERTGMHFVKVER